MNKLEVIKVVGEGAYGTKQYLFHDCAFKLNCTSGIVLKCKNKIDGNFVAVKKFKHSEDESDRKATIREGMLCFTAITGY